MLELKGIQKDYPVGEGVVHALKGIDLRFRTNEFVAILGPSGSGLGYIPQSFNWICVSKLQSDSASNGFTECGTGTDTFRCF